MNNLSTLLKEHWQDAVSVLLGVWLVVSPWVLGFEGNAVALWNSVILGVVLAVASGAALVKFHEWEEWADMAMGLWLVAAPWLLGYAALATPTWNHVLVGLAAIAMAAWSIWHFRHQPGRASA